MKKILSLLLLSIAITQVNAQELNLKDLTAGKYYAWGVQAVTSAADGEHYYQADAKNTQIIKYSYKTGLAVETIFDVKTAKECNFDSFQGFKMSPDENRILVYRDMEYVYRRSFNANYYYFDIRRNHVRPLSENKEKQSRPVFSRDGRMCAFVVKNNIWLARFDYDSESQVTKDGEWNKIINGATDWVYEEEYGTTTIMDFSADNELLAFAKFDESEVKEFSFQTYKNELYPGYYSFKYPKTGEKNSKVTINVFDIDAKTVRKMQLPNDVEYIPRIEFLPEGDDLAIMTLNRTQNDFKMYYANARSTVSRQVLREQNAKYIDSELIPHIRFFGNQFTYVSEKDGYKHIYLYDNTGVLQSQLTNGNYDVTNLYAIDAKDGIIYYQSAEDSPLQRSVYSVEIKKGKKQKLSTKVGTNNATFSSNGKYFVNNFSNTTTPTLVTMNDNKGKELRVLQANEKLNSTLKGMNIPKKEFITLKAADNSTELNAYIIKPSNFDPSKKYPVLMTQYSGPDSQSVLDRFGLDWENYLATQGYVVACVDGRGTGGRGEAFRKMTYMNLGVAESDDQIAAAKQLGKLGYIDSERISIWGWSYGGYNVLMSMSRSQGVFKSGVAIAPVTDWKFYDTVYGERFMRTPQENMDGYKAGSPIELANGLNGNLLLIHGSSDDNVHWQNSVDYIDALIKADKHFEMFMFPDKDHSIVGAQTRNYLYSKVVDFLDRKNR